MPKEQKRTPVRAMMEAQIDENLRKIFYEDLNEDVPAHLSELVARLGEPKQNPGAARTSENDHDNSEEADI